MNSTSSPTAEEGPLRKKLRKGTRSCSESRSTICTSQEIDEDLNDNRRNLRARVGHLEGVVNEILQKLDLQGLDADDERREAVRALESLSAETLTPSSLAPDSPSKYPQPYENEPLQSLFDNAVISRKTPHTTATGNDGRIRQPDLERKRQRLLALLPDKKTMDTIFNACSGWWEAWKVFFPNIELEYGKVSIQQFVSRALSIGSITFISKAVLCLAVSAQQLPPGFDLEQFRLNHPPAKLFEHYVATVEDLVSKDDHLASTIEGIEVMILQANFYLNWGQPRKCWLTLQRAISFSSLSGFQFAKAGGSNPSENSVLDSRKRSIWQFLYWTDRHMSFVLGLPYNINDKYCGVDFTNMAVAPIAQYLLRLSRIAGHLIDRNQEKQHGQTDFHAAFASTLQLDEELDNVAKTAPSSWWGNLPPNVPVDPMAVMAQFWHFHIRVLNHLPFMLESTANKRYIYSLISCVDSAREMLSRYSTLRTHGGQDHVSCKVIDFQAFTASVLVLLNLLGYGHVLSPRDEEQETRDWEMIDDIIIALRKASQEFGGVVAKQSLSVLETLRATKDGYGEREGSKLVIPYFGLISISPGSAFRSKPSENLSATYAQPTPQSLSTVSPRSAYLATADLQSLSNDFVSPEEDPSISFKSLFTADAEDQLFQELGGPWQNPDLDQDWSWILDGVAAPCDY
ncbi:MAG: hypothetical protein M1837_000928 [Sclerophora amabilis]|nr:MAG: hypothetical protein M1837_000928 [Sclerophora amabilis]